MSLSDAVLAVGPKPEASAERSEKKRYSEKLSSALAEEVADSLRDIGFSGARPERGGPGEKAFQGGLGPKKVDVSYSDEQHGLLLAVSIKTICFAPFGKNLKNRFSDLCTEAITLHLRFPYSVVCALFAFPVQADEDNATSRTMPTFQRAMKLFATISGRDEYTDPGEKFEHVCLALFAPEGDPSGEDGVVRLFDAQTQQEISETEYFETLRDIFNARNPHVEISAD